MVPFFMNLVQKAENTQLFSGVKAHNAVEDPEGLNLAPLRNWQYFTAESLGTLRIFFLRIGRPQ